MNFNYTFSASTTACLPACQLYVRMYVHVYIRPTSSVRIGPVFSHNTGYWCATTDLLIRLRFIHCDIVGCFILHCFSFFWLVNKRWEITKEVSINCNGLYLLFHAKGEMHVYMVTWSIKFINKHNVFAMYQFKSAMMVSCWDLYMCSWAMIYQYICC